MGFHWFSYCLLLQLSMEDSLIIAAEVCSCLDRKGVLLSMTMVHLERLVDDIVSIFVGPLRTYCPWDPVRCVGLYVGWRAGGVLAWLGGD